MGKLTNIQPRLKTIDPRRKTLQPAAAHRRTGAWLQERNHRIKLRDQWTCKACGRVTSDLEVDHIVPLHLGGSDDDCNLQCLCAGPGLCHAIKTRQESKGRAL